MGQPDALAAFVSCQQTEHGVVASHQAREGAAGRLLGQVSSIELEIPLPQRLPLLPISLAEVVNGVHRVSLSPVTRPRPIITFGRKEIAGGRARVTCGVQVDL